MGGGGRLSCGTELAIRRRCVNDGCRMSGRSRRAVGAGRVDR